MRIVKQNCWEFIKCGRGPGEASGNTSECPAATTTSCDGLNGGKNGGRICWIIAGTLCVGNVQCSFAEDLASCMSCDFYIIVKTEEAN